MSETQTVTVISKVPTHIRAGVKFTKGKHAYELTAKQLEKVEADPHLRVVTPQPDADGSEGPPPAGDPAGGAAEQLATEVDKLLGAGVESLKQALPRETDTGLLEAALATEQTAGKRTTAIKAIEARLAELQVPE